MKSGFTLIEFLICLAILGILISIFAAPSPKMTQTLESNNWTSGFVRPNGSSNPKESQISCIEGYKFHSGRQILDEQGRGIRCN